MRGQHDLIAMRCKGVIPNLVFVETDGLDIRHDRLFPVDPEYLYLHIDPSERASRLDLRCLVGLTCVVTGCKAERVDDITAACTKAGSARVIAHTLEPMRHGEFACLRITDTTGALTWPNC